MTRFPAALAVAGLAAAALSRAASPTPQVADPDSDGVAIRQAASDYADGYYEGSAERVARAVHPALLKRGLLPPGAADRFLTLMSAEMLIEAAASGNERLPAANRHLDFALLDLRPDIASARIFTARFDDYLLLAKQGGRWRIASVLWQVPAPPGSAEDRRAATRATEEFFAGLYLADAARIRAVVHPELVRRTLRPGARGALFLDDMNVDRLLGETLRVPAVEGGTVQVLDLRDRIASVLVTQEGAVSYVHLARQGGQWRLVNVLSR
jgi:hypothetical protein